MQRGFSLVEVLVAILVLAVGVIGAAGMQLTAMRTSQQGGQHTIAQQLAADMGDRVRAHAAQGTLPTRLALHVDARSAENAGALESDRRNCFSTPCTADEVLAFEVRDWLRRVQSRLPGARVAICVDAHPWDETRRSLRWDCDNGNGSGVVLIKLGWDTRDGSVDGPRLAFAVTPERS